MKALQRLVVVGFLLGAVSFAQSGNAAADDFPGTYLADNREHTYCFNATVNPVPSGNRYRYHDALTYLDTRTVLWDNYVSTCTTETDVKFHEANIDNSGTRGRWQCFNLESGRCTRSNIWIDPAEVFMQSLYVYPGGGQPFTDSYEVNIHKTIRHEVGHSVGTDNDGTSFSDANYFFVMGILDFRGCTVSGFVPTELIWDTYSDHHVSHMATAY